MILSRKKYARAVAGLLLLIMAVLPVMFIVAEAQAISEVKEAQNVGGQSSENTAISAAPVPVPDPPVVSYEPADPAPDTLKALRYMPKQSQTALGIPSAEGLLVRLAPFVQDILPDMDLAKEIDMVATDLASDMGVPNEGGIIGVLTAMGFDSRAGLAIFLNLEEVLKKYTESIASNEISELEIAALKALLVIPVTDPVKAEASLKKFGGELLSNIEITETVVEGVTIKYYGDMGGYFVNDAVLALGNDMDMLADAATRASIPAQFQYGSTICPPEDVHELVALIFGDRLLPFVDLFKEQIDALEPSLQVLVKAQIERVRKIYEGAPAGEPLIITCGVNEKFVELKSKVNTAVYPGLITYTGTPTPLYWAQRLPNSTLTFFSLNFTEEFKNQFTTDYIDYLPEEIRNSPGISQGIMHIKNAIQLFGGEVTFGAARGDAIQYPSIFLITRLADTEGSQIFLQMAPQTDYEAPYRDIQIKEIQAPIPIPVYFAVMEDALIISNSVPGIRGIIDLSKDAQTSGLFESLNPPIPADMPLFQAFMVKLSLYSDIVAPIAAIAGKTLPEDVTPVLDTVSRLFEDIRVINGMQGSWAIFNILASRKPGT